MSTIKKVMPKLAALLFILSMFGMFSCQDPLSVKSSGLENARATAIINDWSSSKYYYMDDLVLWNGDVYKARRDHQAASWQNPQKNTWLWEPLGTGTPEPNEPKAGPWVDSSYLSQVQEYYRVWKNKYICTYEKVGFAGKPTPDFWVYEDFGSFVYYNGPKQWNEDTNSIDWLGSVEEDSCPDDEKKRVTVSEAHGYGMVIAAVMDDKFLFEDLYRFFKKFYHPELGGMHWAIKLSDDYKGSRSKWKALGDPYARPEKNTYSWKDEGFPEVLVREYTPDSNGLPSTATDGDLDIAYALLLAYERWKNPEYLSIAKSMLAKIYETTIHSELKHLKLGNWCPDNQVGGSNWDKFDYSLATRPSDFVLSALYKFREYGNYANWNAVINRCEKVISDLNAFLPGSGPLPDFAYFDRASGKYKPVPTPAQATTTNWKDKNGKLSKFSSSAVKFLEQELYDNAYYYNAPRAPWRLAEAKMIHDDSKFDDEIANFATWAWKAMADTTPVNSYTHQKMSIPEWAEGSLLAAYNMKGEYIPGKHANDEKNMFNPILHNVCLLPAAKISPATRSTFSGIWKTWFESGYSTDFDEWNKIGGRWGIKNDMHAYFDDSVRLLAAITAVYSD